MSFKENLKNELVYNDIKVKELANRVKIPYTTMLSYLDSRAIIPNAEIAVKIAKALNVSVEYLVTGKVDISKSSFKEKYPILYPTIQELLSLPKPILVGIQKFIHILYLNPKSL